MNSVRFVDFFAWAENRQKLISQEINLSVTKICVGKKSRSNWSRTSCERLLNIKRTLLGEWTSTGGSLMKWAFISNPKEACRGFFLAIFPSCKRIKLYRLFCSPHILNGAVHMQMLRPHMSLWKGGCHVRLLINYSFRISALESVQSFLN